MNSHDRKLMEKILEDKKRYSIRVDNDVVWVQDNNKESEDSDYWVGFNTYGYDFIINIFDYLGFDSDGV